MKLISHKLLENEISIKNLDNCEEINKEKWSMSIEKGIEK